MENRVWNRELRYCVDRSHERWTEGVSPTSTGCRRAAPGSDGRTAAWSAGRNVGPASLRGEGISLAVTTVAGRRADDATDRSGESAKATSPPPVEGSQSLLPTLFSRVAVAQR